MTDTQAHLAAAQASLETGYGKDVVGNAYFGIKASPNYLGDVVTTPTTEVVNGTPVGIVDNFRSYDNLADALSGYQNFMPSAFPSAWTAPTVRDAATNLTDGVYGSYATDPNYASKVTSISNRFGPAAYQLANVPAVAPTPYSPNDQQANQGLLSSVFSAPGDFISNVSDFGKNAVTTGQNVVGSFFGTPASIAQVGMPSNPVEGLTSAREMANVTLGMGPNRPYSPDPAVTSAVQTAVTDVLGPNYSVNVTSGQENSPETVAAAAKGLANLSQYGSDRHKTGLAADFTITDPYGNKLSWANPMEVGQLKDVAQALAAQNDANIGLGYLGSPHMMHADLVPASDLSKNQSQQWGVIGKAMEDRLNEARDFSLMPASFYENANQAVIANNVAPYSPADLDKTNQLDGAFGLAGVINNPASVVSQPGMLSAPVAAQNPSVTASGLLGTAPNLAATAVATPSAPSVTATPSGLLGTAPDLSASTAVNASNMVAAPNVSAVGMLGTAPNLSANAVATPSANMPASVSVDVQNAMAAPNMSQALNPSMPAMAMQVAPSVQTTAPAANPAMASLAPAVQAAMAAPNFNQAMNPSMPAMAAQAVPSMPSVPGPATPTDVAPVSTQQQTQQAIADAQKSVTETLSRAPTTTTTANKGLLNGLVTKESLTGSLLGGALLGPAGGLLGGLLGRQVANNGGLKGMFGPQPMNINNIGGGLNTIAGIYGGMSPAGTQGTANNGGLVTSLGNGFTAYTNPMGVTTITSPTGDQQADWSGRDYGGISGTPGVTGGGTVGSGTA